MTESSNSFVTRLSDEILWQQFCTGQGSAFQILYQRHESALLRYLIRLLHRPEIAHEVFQETWLAIIKMSENEATGNEVTENNHPMNFAASLYTVARHKAIDHLRALKNQVWEAKDEVAEMRFGEDTEPQDFDLSDALLTKQLGEAILVCIAALPILQREAFVLQHETGLTLLEIAHMTDAPVETVKSRLRYARNALQQNLEAWR